MKMFENVLDLLTGKERSRFKLDDECDSSNMFPNYSCESARCHPMSDMECSRTRKSRASVSSYSSLFESPSPRRHTHPSSYLLKSKLFVVVVVVVLLACCVPVIVARGDRYHDMTRMYCIIQYDDDDTGLAPGTYIEFYGTAPFVLEYSISALKPISSGVRKIT